MKKEKKVVLAYSGGLDTSCCLAWLKERGYEVVCFSAGLGSEFSPSELRKKAGVSGARAIYIKDLRRELAEEYILPVLKSGAVYEGKYLLGTALGRPLIAKHLVDVARKEKACFVAHGCSAKGNDQVRIEIGVKSLAPDISIIAPLREWELTSRESEVEYAKKRSLPVDVTKEKIYSVDKNIWGVSIEAGILEDLNSTLPEEAFILTKGIDKAPNKPQIVEISFEEGRPVKLNGRRASFLNIIESLNEIGGRHGIGRTDLIEDRTVGIKSREVYEAPAAWILHTAHKELESVVLDAQTLHIKNIMSLEYARLVYGGLWFTHFKKTLDAFIEASQERANGTVSIKLHKGNMVVSGRSSKNSLYSRSLATYGKEDAFNREWAEGFINIWGMPFIEK